MRGNIQFGIKLNIFFANQQSMPTILETKSLVSTNPKIKTEDLQEFTAAHFILQEIKYKLNKPVVNIHDRVLLIVGQTGSGKTTALIVELLRMFGSANPKIPDESRVFRDQIGFDFGVYDFPDDPYTIKNREAGITPTQKTSSTILCAQPTTILARTKAQEISKEPWNPDLELGQNVGYNTGTFKLFPKMTSNIVYCTMGVLSTIMKTKVGHDDEIKQKYSFIVVDECHEQSTEMIEGLFYVINFCRRNAGDPSCPFVILMSATFDHVKYANYFGTNPSNSVIVKGGKLIREIFHLEEPSYNIYSDIADKVALIHKEGHDDPDNHCDILVFLPGDGEINRTQKMIEALDPNKEMYLGKITSEINQRGGPEVDYLTKFTLEELKTELKRPGIKRRVILATSVVETGLTIDTLKYCVDSCLAKYVIYFPIHNCSGLLVEQMAMSSGDQRAGRVGRVKPGIVYRMMEERLLGELEEYKRTDLYTTDITKMILDTTYINVTLEKNKKMDTYEFQDFVENCMIPENCKDQLGCKNAYAFRRSPGNSQKFFKTDKINLYPHRLLDLIPTDVFIQSRNKLYALGFWGTYAGYVASKIGRLSIESIRMVLSGYAYNVSINDLLIIGLFVDSGQKNYRYTSQNKPKHIQGIELYDTRKIIKSVLGKSAGDARYLGSADDFHEELYDEFIEPLFIVRWYAKNLRKYGPSAMVGRGRKFGINIHRLTKMLEPRNQIQSQLKKIGYLSVHKDIDFKSESFLDDIVRLKQCVHSGFRLNIAYLDKDNIHYVTNTGLRLTPNDVRLKNKPHKIIFGSLFMTMGQGSPTYEPVPIYVSGLAGII